MAERAFIQNRIEDRLYSRPFQEELTDFLRWGKAQRESDPLGVLRGRLTDSETRASVYVRLNTRPLAPYANGFVVIFGGMISPRPVPTLDIGSINFEGEIGKVKIDEDKKKQHIKLILSDIYRIAPQYGIKALYADNIGDHNVLLLLEELGWQKLDQRTSPGAAYDNRYESGEFNPFGDPGARYILLPEEANIINGLLVEE